MHSKIFGFFNLGDGICWWVTTALFLILLVLIYYIWDLINRLKALARMNKEFERNLEEVDEQARLVIQTDLEMNEIQEKIDERMRALLALQRLSRIFSSSLEKEKIFAGFNSELLGEIGFNVCILVLKETQPRIRVEIGLEPERKKYLEKFLQEKNPFSILKQYPLIISNQNYAESDVNQWQDFISNNLALKFFLITALVIEGNVEGFLVLGNSYGIEDFEGKKEIAEILSFQLSRTLENINLFEELFRTKQALEMKVQERTRELSQALERLKKINKLKSEFVSAVSHEFRTPLTSIKGYASLLAKDKFGKVSDEIKMRLERIDQQADILVDMINKMLDIARIESGRVSVELAKDDITKVAQEVLENMQPQIKEKNLHIEFQSPPHVVFLFDKNMIRRVFTNLLSNAVKFTPSQGTIRIIIEESAEEVKVVVQDSGIGIPAEDLENVFREFYRVESGGSKEIKGTGLGLSLVKNIIAAHKGKIWAESQPSRGATFIFILPKKRQEV